MAGRKQKAWAGQWDRITFKISFDNFLPQKPASDRQSQRPTQSQKRGKPGKRHTDPAAQQLSRSDWQPQTFGTGPHWPTLGHRLGPKCHNPYLAPSAVNLPKPCSNLVGEPAAKPQVMLLKAAHCHKYVEKENKRLCSNRIRNWRVRRLN